VNSILEFIKAMTIWNWLSLIAFLVLPFTALNTFFSLRTRFQDWRGVRSKKSVEKRIKQLSAKVRQIGRFSDSRNTFYTYMIDVAMKIALSFLTAFFIFVWVFLIDISPMRMLGVESLLLIVCQLFMLNAVTIPFKVLTIIDYVRHPNTLVKEVEDFMRNGQAKELLAEEDRKSMFRLLHRYKLLPEKRVAELKVTGTLPQ
jgi:hypothetical protein